MKVYVVTDCASEENYTPMAFDTYEKAKEYFDNRVNNLIETEEYVDNYEISNDYACIVYTDDTYDVIDIFELDVK